MDVDIALDVTETINDIDIALIISGDSDLLPLRQYVVKKENKLYFQHLDIIRRGACAMGNIFILMM